MCVCVCVSSSTGRGNPPLAGENNGECSYILTRQYLEFQTNNRIDVLPLSLLFFIYIFIHRQFHNTSVWPEIRDVSSWY